MKDNIKRIYNRPILTGVTIDREITLVMASEGSPGGDPQGAPAASSGTDANSFKENPFGEKQ